VKLVEAPEEPIRFTVILSGIDVIVEDVLEASEMDTDLADEVSSLSATEIDLFDMELR
jgi:hypothetical protein